MTTHVFSQSGNSQEETITLPSLSVHGEKLPTIFLQEFSIIAEK
jgi:hypothetical protein